MYPNLPPTLIPFFGSLPWGGAGGGGVQGGAKQCQLFGILERGRNVFSAFPCPGHPGPVLETGVGGPQCEQAHGI